jgi:hypothetical protein
MSREFITSKALALFVLLVIVVPLGAAEQVAWVKNFDDALKLASRENKFIVLDMSASW